MDNIRADYFSNKKLKLFYPWIIPKISQVEKEINQLIKSMGMLKHKYSFPYYKSVIPAKKLNDLREKLLKNTSGTINMYQPNREEFMKCYNIPDVCEGCGNNPIQEEAHILMRSKLTKIKSLKLKEYGSYYANILLLCATCHRIIDNKGGNVTQSRLSPLIRNLSKRDKLNKKIYERLKEDKRFIKSVRLKLDKIYLMPKKKAINQIKFMLKQYRVI